MLVGAGSPSHCRSDVSRTCRSLRLPLLLILIVLSLLPCTSAPADLWSEFEKTVGRMALADMIARHGEVKEPLLERWVNSVGQRVAEHSTRHLTFRFKILDSFENNAFSLPGGYICVTRGLLTHVASDEELAGVIAHEVAHAENRDFQRLLEQQLMFLGAQSLLRGNVDDEWILASQIVQVLEGFRRSRKHELQADLAGTNLAYSAGYDPQGIISFLQDLGPNANVGGRALATHPEPSRRVTAVRERVRELQAAEPEGLLRVGESLEERLHYARAAEVFEKATADQPADARAWEDLARVRELQGLSAQAEAARQRVAAATPAPSARPPLLTDATTRAAVSGTLGELRRQEQALHEQEKRLRASLQRFGKDRQITQALELAQVIAPETHDEAYLATLARAYYVLAQAWREAMRHGEVLSRGAAVRAGWERSATDLLAEEGTDGAAANAAEAAGLVEAFRGAPGSVTATAEALRQSNEVVGELHAATRMLAVAFLALVASGDDQPLGRLNYTRFLLLQGDIAWAEHRIRRSGQGAKQAHREVIRQHLEALAMQISLLHATARPALRELDRKLVARRLQLPEESWPGDKSRPLGYAALDAPAGAEGKRPEPQDLDALLRVAYLDMRAERGR